MARAVAASLADDTPLLFEAGTGVGKSLAYLVPGIIHAVDQSRQLIVSTHTISLQEQIEQKDLPLCRRLFKSDPAGAPYADFRSTVLVGKSNYLCPTRLSHTLADRASLFADATWVFVPYCTGDLHAGTQTTVYEALGQMRTMHHVGGHNMDAALARIAPYAPTEVFAIGVSAGGYGAQLNWDRIAGAFAPATTHMLADGAQMVPIYDSRWPAMRTRWATRFPTGCSDCATNLDLTGAFWRAAPPANGGSC